MVRLQGLCDVPLLGPLHLLATVAAAQPERGEEPTAFGGRACGPRVVESSGGPGRRATSRPVAAPSASGLCACLARQWTTSPPCAASTLLGAVRGGC